MSKGQFPSPETNLFRRELKQKLGNDPRAKLTTQIRDTPPLHPPQRLRRSGKRGLDWGLTRTLKGYWAEQDTAIQGKAPKWVIRNGHHQDDFFIAKFGKKNGRIEVLTELLNNRIGEAFGFQMAHAGVARCDEHLYFVSRNFRDNEALIHGSLLIAELFAVESNVLDHVQAVEQEFYSIDFIRDAIVEYCGICGEDVFQKFIEMLVFDALIGSQDRHPMNWGVLRPEIRTDENCRFRLAPLFDSARALLWSEPEAKLLLMDSDPSALRRYVDNAKPCIGPQPGHPKINHCNHFEFVAHLLELYPHQTLKATKHFADKPVGSIVRRLLKQAPFSRGFSNLRKRVVVKVFETRVRRLRQVLQEGGEGHVEDKVHYPATAH